MAAKQVLKDNKISWSKKEVEALLDQQKADCADCIQRNNLSEYTAKKKILDCERVKF